MITDKEAAFIAQSARFRELACELYPFAADLSLGEVLAQPASAAPPTVLTDTNLSTSQVDEIVAAYHGTGVAYFVFDPPRPPRTGRHALLDLADQLAHRLPTAHAIDHPMERHPEAISRFGAPDGTLKLYDLPIPPDVNKYREQAETNQMFDAHNDGLGYGGKVATIAMSLDSPPLWGGFTYFANVIAIALALANDDSAAFEALFLPDAITALRPRGKGAIRVTTPILYINDAEKPQAFYRRASGEYKISVRKDYEPLGRALSVLARCTAPFGPSSSVVHFSQPGEGVLVNNEHVVHGRTDFINGKGSQRVLARKWFTREASDAAYKHVPGMNVAPSYGDMFPELFGMEMQLGEWHYDAPSDANVKL